MFCYPNGQLRKAEQNDEILRFVEFWKDRTGRLPEELVFDSKLTTYANLSRLTNQLTRSARKLIGRYAGRMIVENLIADGIEFFHMDALSSAVAMKIDCDLQLMLMASSLYRLLGSQVANGYEHAKAQHVFRDFIDANATVSIREKDIVVRFQKRAHNPLLLAAGFGKARTPVPWLGGKTLSFLFG